MTKAAIIRKIQFIAAHFYGGGEAEENSVMVFEDVKDLKHLPPMYAVGDDMLTGVYLIGKATLRMMYCGEAEE